MSSKIILKDAIKTYTLDQDKTIPPEETVKRFKKKLKRSRLDLLSRTVRIDNGRLSIPVYLSYCGADAEKAIGSRKQMGKGGTPTQAEASAVMELVERYSFFSYLNSQEHFQTEQFVNLDDRAISFDLIAKSVHDDSGELAVARKLFETIPFRWAPAYNLTKGKEVLIPFDWFYMINEFNGPSAGNCNEEAILQGICEVVERHVSSIVSRNELSVPAIDPDSLTDPMVKEMVGKFRYTGIEFYLSDFTLDMGIPTVGILAFDRKTLFRSSEIVWTAGTTPSPEKAVSRAFTEAAQLAGDFNTNSNYVASGLPKPSSIEEMEYIIRTNKEIDIDRLPDLSDNNIKTEVRNCIAALEKKGMEVIVVNTTHPKLKIPAFYTIIPGAYFRERAIGTSVGMFAAKYIAENSHPWEAFEKLTWFDKELPNKYYNQFYLGYVNLSLNNREEALDCFEKALDLGPNEQDIPSIYSYMGVCLKDMERYDEAIDVLETGEEVDPNRTDIHNLKGFCHYKQGRFELAIHSFEKVIELNPSSAIDYANIGSNYREMGESKKAMEYYKVALSIDPTIDFAAAALENLMDSDKL